MIRCQYVPEGQSELFAGERTSQLLAAVGFDRECLGAVNEEISTGLPVIAGGAVKECIITDESVRKGRADGLFWAEDGEHLMVALWRNETSQPLAALEPIAFELYQTLFQTMTAQGFPYLVRIWNYFADINAERQGLERYRQFCLGRYEAFKCAGLVEGDFPSACALGHRGGDVLVYALASKQRPQHFENPNQQAAYHYPEEYGPRSPSFARATLLERSLYVSGTASVVGHKTLYAGDVQAQTSTTLLNLSELLAHVARQQNCDTVNWQADILKVYVRHADDVAVIQPMVQQAYPGVPCVFLAADICRTDLLLEIDGIWTLNR